MAIQFSIETKYSLKNRMLLKRWVKAVLENKGKKLGNLYFILCDDDFLLKINRQFLKHDYYTDIITFDYTEDGIIAGDLFISIDRVMDNATALQVSEHEELMRVMIHGVLHLLGLKDKSDEEAKQMRKAEEECLELLKEMSKQD